jgi:hypothetical protein
MNYFFGAAAVVVFLDKILADFEGAASVEELEKDDSE